MRCTCPSTSPGRIVAPGMSITCAPSGTGRPRPAARMAAPSMITVGSGSTPVPSNMRAARSAVSVGRGRTVMADVVMPVACA